ncbi:MAG: DNA polymerase III subunit delta' [Propionibacteriaceae bacterium]|nr:DNA polymerase III subunit delta' [Propionibacteriaceae bacterium]
MSVTTNVWADLVGQQRAVQTLKRAATQPGAMTHAWLFTGPPGSGRSVAARAFAAALQCPNGGCGACQTCRTCLSGAHPDVVICRTEQLSIGIAETRDLVDKASKRPMVGPWQVLIIEDADRVGDRAADALLKSLEEPPPRTVWLLCAPNADDMIVTIRSRCREVRLVTPSDEAVVEVLTRRDGISHDDAWQAARAAQGHIGRARALARDAEARAARQRIVDLPSTWTSLAACLNSAAEVVGQAQAQAEAQTAELDQRERQELEVALGLTTRGVRPRSAAAAMSHLEDEQKLRGKRLQRDALDNVLTELATWYRDVLAVQSGVDASHVINIGSVTQVQAAAAASTVARTTGSLDAILAARRAIDTSVAPLLAMESLFVDLAHPAS